MFVFAVLLDNTLRKRHYLQWSFCKINVMYYRSFMQYSTSQKITRFQPVNFGELLETFKFDNQNITSSFQVLLFILYSSVEENKANIL